MKKASRNAAQTAGQRGRRGGNSLPALLDAVRPNLNDVAEWAGRTRAAVEAWRERRAQPKADQREALVLAVRQHAARLLDLAAAVEREGRACNH